MIQLARLPGLFTDDMNSLNLLDWSNHITMRGVKFYSKLLWLLISTFAVALAPRAFCDDQTADKPLVAITGPHSRIEQPTYKLINNRKDLIDLWLLHKGAQAAGEYDDFYNPAEVPEINFNKCMVIAVFAGRVQNVAAIEATSYTDANAKITLRFRKRGYQTAGRDGGAEETTPYGLFIVPLSKNPIVVEETVSEYKNQAPIGTEVVRFPKR